MENCDCAPCTCLRVCSKTLLPLSWPAREPMDADLLQSATVEMSIKVSALDSCAPRIAQERRLVEGLRLHRSVGRLTTGSCQECSSAPPRASCVPLRRCVRCRQLRCPPTSRQSRRAWDSAESQSALAARPSSSRPSSLIEAARHSRPRAVLPAWGASSIRAPARARARAPPPAMGGLGSRIRNHNHSKRK